MKKLVLVCLMGLYAGGTFAADQGASTSAEKGASGKAAGNSTSAVVSDEKVGNDKGKPLVKKASPQARQSAKDAADKTQGKSGSAAK